MKLIYAFTKIFIWLNRNGSAEQIITSIKLYKVYAHGHKLLLNTDLTLCISNGLNGPLKACLQLLKQSFPKLCFAIDITADLLQTIPNRNWITAVQFALHFCDLFLANSRLKPAVS